MGQTGSLGEKSAHRSVGRQLTGMPVALSSSHGGAAAMAVQCVVVVSARAGQPELLGSTPCPGKESGLVVRGEDCTVPHCFMS